MKDMVERQESRKKIGCNKEGILVKVKIIDIEIEFALICDSSDKVPDFQYLAIIENKGIIFDNDELVNYLEERSSFLNNLSALNENKFIFDSMRENEIANDFKLLDVADELRTDDLNQLILDEVPHFDFQLCIKKGNL